MMVVNGVFSDMDMVIWMGSVCDHLLAIHLSFEYMLYLNKKSK